MKTVELRRHTDNDGDQLTDEGVAAAREVGAWLTPPYDLWVSSGAERATQTLRIWQEVVGVDAPIEDNPGLRSEQEGRWREVYSKAGSGNLSAMRDADPEFVAAESAALGAALGAILDRLPDGGAALACGHSPTNEAAVLGLTGEIIDPMSKGAGVRVGQHEDGTFAVESLP
jgi:broad specificity phosphatase PhoE